MENLYGIAMKGIRQKVAMQEIRKIIRTDKTDEAKLAFIIDIVHAFEDDLEIAAREEERRAIEEEEAADRRERINDMFEEMAAPLNNLVLAAKGEKK